MIKRNEFIELSNRAGHYMTITNLVFLIQHNGFLPHSHAVCWIFYFNSKSSSNENLSGNKIKNHSSTCHIQLLVYRNAFDEQTNDTFAKEKERKRDWSWKELKITQINDEKNSLLAHDLNFNFIIVVYMPGLEWIFYGKYSVHTKFNGFFSRRKNEINCERFSSFIHFFSSYD